MNFQLPYRSLLFAIPALILSISQPLARTVSELSPVEIIRVKFEYADAGPGFPTVQRNLDLELFSDLTPITVANILSYVDDQRYDSTFVHRIGFQDFAKTQPFVIQTGGFTHILPDPINDDVISPSNFGAVTEFAPILNEPAPSVGLSNIRGTVAMAKSNPVFRDVDGVVDPTCVAESATCILVPGTGVNSATSQWFVNLKDNGINTGFVNNLDEVNGGFTVFGSVIDDGMNIADEISGMPIENFAFINLTRPDLPPIGAEVPIANYDDDGVNFPRQKTWS